MRRDASRRAPPDLRQRDPGPKPAPLGLAGRELEHSARTPARRHPPGRELGCDLEDPVSPVEEDGVDREPHEGGVDGRRRPEQHPLTRGKAAPAKEAAQAGERRLREETVLADDVAVVVRQCDLRQCHV